MSESHGDPNESKQAWEDRLSEAALREVVGGEQPPDLTERVLAAAAAEGAEKMRESKKTTTKSPPITPAGRQPIVRRRLAWLLATAAMLTVTSLLILPAVRYDLTQRDTLSQQHFRALADQSAAKRNANETLAREDTQNARAESQTAGTPQAYSKPDSVHLQELSGSSAGNSQGDFSSPAAPTNAQRGAAARGRGFEAIEGGGFGGMNAPFSSPSREGRSREGRFEGGSAARTAGNAVDRSFNSRREGRFEGDMAPPVVYPEPRAWEDLNGRRSKYAAEGRRQEGGRRVQRFGRDSEAAPVLSGRAASKELTQAPTPRFGRYEGEEVARLRSRIEHSQGREKYKQDEMTTGQDEVFREAQIQQLIRREMDTRRGGDRYARVQDNPFIPVKGAAAVSTFSIDVDTASYTNVRQYLMRSNQLPPPSAVRIEEMINYFDYSYEGPDGNTAAPFAAHIEVARCPWNSGNQLARVALKGREIDSRERPVSNLVFLVDVSGSMNEPNKLPLVVDGLRQLTHELGENDRVAIVVYASAEGLALPSTQGTDKDTILGVLDRLNAGGSTAGGAGIELAYTIAQENFVDGGVNRVILCTDGDFNVGVSDTAGLQRLAERKAQEANVFLTVLGFGRGNLNDEMMETISNKGNGNYHYIDNSRKARKVLIEQMSGTLVTIAKDVKIQIEFNPAHVAAYRLIGYENRILAREDFDDDKKDAGEIGAGHTVTALYELVPTGVAAANSDAEPLKYQDEPATQPQGQPVAAEANDRFNDELFTLRLRYKQPDEDTSTKIEFAAKMNDTELPKASDDFRFAAAVASFGMLLRNSAHCGDATLESVLELAAAGRRNDPHGYRSEFVDLVRRAQQLCR